MFLYGVFDLVVQIVDVCRFLHGQIILMTKVMKAQGIQEQVGAAARVEKEQGVRVISSAGDAAPACISEGQKNGPQDEYLLSGRDDGIGGRGIIRDKNRVFKSGEGKQLRKKRLIHPVFQVRPQADALFWAAFRCEAPYSGMEIAGQIFHDTVNIHDFSPVCCHGR